MFGGSKWILGAAVVGVLTGAGCGKSSDLELAPVKGVVKLNGEPLLNAIVEFNPKDYVLPKRGDKKTAQGGSVGVTDEGGNYKLQFNNQFEGAIVGEHTVRIVPVLDPDEQAAKNAAAKKRDVAALTKVLQTQLSYKVQPGENTYDIELKTR